MKIISPLNFIIPAIVAVTFISCQPETKPEVVEEQTEDTQSETAFSKLTGKWADTSGENQFFEVWNPDGDAMQGTGVVMANGDTVFIEHLGIVSRDSKWYYSARIDGANNNEPVFFEYKEKSTDYLVFENPEHDFPQLIEYQFRGSDSLLITISGAAADSARVEHFRMKRVMM
jgi:hypothetical protein